ncbi:serine hydrolase domain-containing protein [Thaumasiovibrio sp. DFM-14]|uniref:serine hydrolase domain-containing protein n=1 Tax=Thaumasiovibrio sp. DFM-14 TaxID=3384792 RepID=UPI0039A0C6D4
MEQWRAYIICCSLLLTACEQGTEELDGQVEPRFAPMIERISDGTVGNLHGLVVWQRGVTRLEYYGSAPGMAGFQPASMIQGAADKHFNLHSATKLVAALLTFIAVDEGRIASLDEPIRNYLPSLPQQPTRWQKITFRHALEMTTGLALDEAALPKQHINNDWNRMNQSEDVLAFIYQQPFKSAPGSEYRYSGSGTILIAAALAEIYGSEYPLLAKEKLFSPLDISSQRWLRFQNGAMVSSDAGLQLTVIDMVKLGQLLLQKGEWNEHPLIQPHWIESAMALDENNEARSLLHTKIEDVQDGRLVIHGDGEQYIWVLPQQQAVLVSAAGNYRGEEQVYNLLNAIPELLND